MEIKLEGLPAEYHAKIKKETDDQVLQHDKTHPELINQRRLVKQQETNIDMVSYSN